MKYVIFYKKEAFIRESLRIYFDTHIRNMKRNEFWGTKLKIMAFSDMMRLHIIFNTSLDQNFTEVKINHPYNNRVIISIKETEDFMKDYKGIKMVIMKNSALWKISKNLMTTMM